MTTLETTQHTETIEFDSLPEKITALASVTETLGEDEPLTLPAEFDHITGEALLGKGETLIDDVHREDDESVVHTGEAAKKILFSLVTVAEKEDSPVSEDAAKLLGIPIIDEDASRAERDALEAAREIKINEVFKHIAVVEPGEAKDEVSPLPPMTLSRDASGKVVRLVLAGFDQLVAANRLVHEFHHDAEERFQGLQDTVAESINLPADKVPAKAFRGEEADDIYWAMQRAASRFEIMRDVSASSIAEVSRTREHHAAPAKHPSMHNKAYDIAAVHALKHAKVVAPSVPVQVPEAPIQMFNSGDALVHRPAMVEQTEHDHQLAA